MFCSAGFATDRIAGKEFLCRQFGGMSGGSVCRAPLAYGVGLGCEIVTEKPSSRPVLLVVLDFLDAVGVQIAKVI
jgi:hypothetical protein